MKRDGPLGEAAQRIIAERPRADEALVGNHALDVVARDALQAIATTESATQPRLGLTQQFVHAGEGGPTGVGHEQQDERGFVAIDHDGGSRIVDEADGECERGDARRKAPRRGTGEAGGDGRGPRVERPVVRTHEGVVAHDGGEAVGQRGDAWGRCRAWRVLDGL